MQKNQRLKRERRSTEMMMNRPHLNTGTCPSVFLPHYFSYSKNQHGKQIDSGFLKGPIMAHTQILIHR